MKSVLVGRADGDLKSPPSRGAWIEIHRRVMTTVLLFVAPLAGGVD